MMTMEGWIAFSGLWYVFLTCCGWIFGQRYNRWVESERGQQTATCYQVVIGVAATEALRLVRAFPLMMLLAPVVCRAEVWWLIPVIIIGAWPIDATAAYAATGWPMIRGQLQRKARERAEGVGAVVEEAREVTQ